MFPEARITRALLLLLGCLLFTSGEEAVRLQELKGTTVTIHTGLTGVQSDAHILWFYGSEKADENIVNSLEFEGKTKTNYISDRFRDRLHLDRSSGSLTIRNISREDSGVYKLQIIKGKTSDWSFRVKVYGPVSIPDIRNGTGNHSELCSPVCSVENGEDVTLSWYEEKERISSISRSDSSEHLHLPLNRTFPNIYTYTCESANPVSNQTTQLNIAELCDFNSDKNRSTPTKPLVAVLISVGLAGIALLIISLLWFNTKKRKQSVSEDDDAEVNYAEVAAKKPEEVQNSKPEDNGDSVVYSSVRA